MWAQAYELALKICNIKVLDLLPPNLNEGDIGQYSKITVDLSKEDELQKAQRKAAGLQLYEKGLISFIEFQVEYNGKSMDEAQNAKDDVYLDFVERNSPAFQMYIEQQIAKEQGIIEEINRINQALNQSSGINPVPQYGSEGGEPRNGNIQTQTGANMADQGAFHELRRS
jgi:hypothetical protein